MKHSPDLFPYPAAEYLAQPTTPAEVIFEEIRTGGSGEALRESILYGIGAVYHGSELARSLWVDSKTLARSAMSADGVEIPLLYRSEAFFSGAMLGVHAEVSLLDKDERWQALNRWRGNKQAFDENQNEYMQNVAVRMHDASSRYVERLEVYPEALHYAIVTASIASFADKPDEASAVAYAEAMTFGATHAIDAIADGKLGIERS